MPRSVYPSSRYTELANCSPNKCDEVCPDGWERFQSHGMTGLWRSSLRWSRYHIHIGTVLRVTCNSHGSALLNDVLWCCSQLFCWRKFRRGCVRDHSPGDTLQGTCCHKVFPFCIQTGNPCFSSMIRKISYFILPIYINLHRRKGHIYVTYADNTFLPFALLAARTFLPPAVAILALNPWTFALERFFGWNVIFIDIHLLSIPSYMNRSLFTFLRHRISL